MVNSEENPLIDLGNTTVQAFNIIKEQEKQGKKAILGRDDNLSNTTNHSVIVYVYTPQDKQKHSYFHSLSIDKQVEDFMGTAELRAAYDSDLMKYWEPIRNYCVIYGSNKGKSNIKILFIGRVREIKQEGYELVITFQDYGWKFKQPVSQSYANDNVINKDGYTIMKLMFSALKIDSWVVSPVAKKRLQQVGYDKDGNLTLNKKKIEEMPNLIERLKKSDPNQSINKWTVYNKIKESKQGNVKNINYTLRYEKPTPVMKKISSESSGDFAPGQSVYGTNYGASSGGGGGSSSNNKNNVSASGTPRPPDDLCKSINNEKIISAMKLIWSYNRGYANDYSEARKAIVNYAQNTPATYSAKAAPCLSTLSKYCIRKDGINAAQIIKSEADRTATWSGAQKGVMNHITNSTVNIMKGVVSRANKVGSKIRKGDLKGAVMAAIFG